MKKLIAVLLIALVVLSACDDRRDYNSLMEDYGVLEDKYEKACGRIDNMRETLGNLEDDLATLYCYFGNEASFSEAVSAFNHLNSVIKSIK